MLKYGLNEMRTSQETKVQMERTNWLVRALVFILVSIKLLKRCWNVKRKSFLKKIWQKQEETIFRRFLENFR